MFIKVYSNNIQVFHLENWNFTFGTRPLEWCGYYVVFNETFRILSDKHHPHDVMMDRLTETRHRNATLQTLNLAITLL